MNYEGDNGDHDEEIFTIVSIVKVDGTTLKRWPRKGPRKTKHGSCWYIYKKL